MLLFFSHVAGLLVPVLCGSQPLWVLSFVLFFGFTLASGYLCFWPAVSGAYAVCAVSAALSSWVSFCCDCGCWSQSFVPSCCSCLLSSCRTLSFCFSRLGFFLWRLFRLGIEVLRSWLWILPSFFSFFFWGGGWLSLFPLSLLF